MGTGLCLSTDTTGGSIVGDDSNVLDILVLDQQQFVPKHIFVPVHCGSFAGGGGEGEAKERISISEICGNQNKVVQTIAFSNRAFCGIELSTLDRDGTKAIFPFPGVFATELPNYRKCE